MHDIVVEELERYLIGEASPALHEHLNHCGDCRREVEALLALSSLLKDLRLPADTSPMPPLGFYNRVAATVVEKQRREAWGLFSPGAVFFRRVAFASLLVLAGLGGFLVTRESSAGGADAATIMAQHDVSGVHSESDDRDRLLVTLASYRQ